MEPPTSIAEQFAGGGTMPVRLAALRQVMTDKALKAFASTPEFSAGLKALEEIAQLGSSPVDRLLAFDGLIRLWNSSLPGPVVRDIEDRVKRALGQELPPLNTLGDSQDAGVDKPSESRLNVVLALDLSDEAWITRYRMRSLPEEERAPKVRLELAKQILRRDTTVEALLSELASLIAERGSTWRQKPEAASRRLRDLVASLREAQQEIDGDPGERFGDALGQLVEAAIGHSGPKSLDSDAAGLADELVRLTLVAIRARLSLMLEPTSYRVIRLVADWWGAIPRPSKLQESILALAKRLEDAILVLSRMGQRSAELVSRYIAAVGEERPARQRLSAFISHYSGIDPAIAQWLRTGIVPRTDPGVSKDDDFRRALVAQSDEATGLLMVDAHALMTEIERVRAAGDGAIGPGTGALDAALVRAERLANDVLALGRERGMELRGRPGDLVEFSPTAHQSVSAVPNEPTVVLLTPVVVRRSQLGGEMVVLKGHVRGREQ